MGLGTDNRSFTRSGKRRADAVRAVFGPQHLHFYHLRLAYRPCGPQMPMHK